MVRLSGSILTLGVSKEEAKTNLCPLLAVSGPSFHSNIGHMNVRFGEKRTFVNYMYRPKITGRPNPGPYFIAIVNLLY